MPFWGTKSTLWKYQVKITFMLGFKVFYTSAIFSFRILNQEPTHYGFYVIIIVITFYFTLKLFLHRRKLGPIFSLMSKPLYNQRLIKNI